MTASKEINSTVQEIGTFIHTMALPGIPKQEQLCPVPNVGQTNGQALALASVQQPPLDLHSPHLK